jgi:hypothetical protein
MTLEIIFRQLQKVLGRSFKRIGGQTFKRVFKALFGLAQKFDLLLCGSQLLDFDEQTREQKNGDDRKADTDKRQNKHLEFLPCR